MNNYRYKPIRDIFYNAIINLLVHIMRNILNILFNAFETQLFHPVTTKENYYGLIEKGLFL